MNTLLVNSSYPPPTQSPFTNQSCLAQSRLRRSSVPQILGWQVQQTFPICILGVVGAFSPSQKIVPYKRQVSLCRIKRLYLDVCVLYWYNSLRRKYSIIHRKMFVNTERFLLFMIKHTVWCYISLYAVISCYPVPQKFFCRSPRPQSMVEINGKPPLTGETVWTQQ